MAINKSYLIDIPSLIRELQMIEKLNGKIIDLKKVEKSTTNQKYYVLWEYEEIEPEGRLD